MGRRKSEITKNYLSENDARKARLDFRRKERAERMRIPTALKIVKSFYPYIPSVDKDKREEIAGKYISQYQRGLREFYDKESPKTKSFVASKFCVPYTMLQVNRRLQIEPTYLRIFTDKDISFGYNKFKILSNILFEPVERIGWDVLAKVVSALRIDPGKLDPDEADGRKTSSGFMELIADLMMTNFVDNVQFNDKILKKCTEDRSSELREIIRNSLIYGWGLLSVDNIKLVTTFNLISEMCFSEEENYNVINEFYLTPDEIRYIDEQITAEQLKNGNKKATEENEEEED